MTARSPRAEALALLGLAQRAGAVVKGAEACRQALRKDEARLVLVAGDASDAQVRKVVSLARAKAVPWRTLGDRAALGAALGSGPLTAVAVTRKGFADQIEDRVGRD